MSCIPSSPHSSCFSVFPLSRTFQCFAGPKKYSDVLFETNNKCSSNIFWSENVVYRNFQATAVGFKFAALAWRHWGGASLNEDLPHLLVTWTLNNYRWERFHVPFDYYSIATWSNIKTNYVSHVSRSLNRPRLEPERPGNKVRLSLHRPKAQFSKKNSRCLIY